MNNLIISFSIINLLVLNNPLYKGNLLSLNYFI